RLAVQRGPPVGAAAVDLGQVVGRGAAAPPVALVDRGPEDAGARMEREAHRVAQAGGEEALARAVGLVAHDRGPAVIRLPADVARRPDAEVERAVRSERDP